MSTTIMYNNERTLKADEQLLAPGAQQAAAWAGGGGVGGRGETARACRLRRCARKPGPEARAQSFSRPWKSGEGVFRAEAECNKSWPPRNSSQVPCIGKKGFHGRAAVSSWAIPTESEYPVIGPRNMDFLMMGRTSVSVPYTHLTLPTIHPV